MARILLISFLLTSIISCGKSSSGGGGTSEAQGSQNELSTSRCKVEGDDPKEVALSGYHSLENCTDEEFDAEIRD